MQIDNFSYQLPDGRQLFDHLTATFEPGKLNILLGVNGVGKTTLLDFIAGVSEQRHLPFTGFPTMQRIAYHMQGAPFTGTATVFETIKMMADLDRPAENFQVDQLPENLQVIAQTRLKDLSGGQRQLVLLAGVCQLERDLYLFDEPESGLDVKVAVAVIDQIKQLVARGKTVIMTTHQFRNLPTENVHVLVLAGQCIAFSGSRAELMAETDAETLEDAYLKTDA